MRRGVLSPRPRPAHWSTRRCIRSGSRLRNRGLHGGAWPVAKRQLLALLRPGLGALRARPHPAYGRVHGARRPDVRVHAGPRPFEAKARPDRPFEPRHGRRSLLAGPRRCAGVGLHRAPRRRDRLLGHLYETTRRKAEAVVKARLAATEEGRPKPEAAPGSLEYQALRAAEETAARAAKAGVRPGSLEYERQQAERGE